MSGEGSSKPLPPIDLLASLSEEPVLGKQVMLHVKAVPKTDVAQLKFVTKSKRVDVGALVRDVFPAAINKICECDIPITCSTTERAYVDVGVSADLPDGTKISRVVRVSFNGEDENPEPPQGGIERIEPSGQKIIEYEQK